MTALAFAALVASLALGTGDGAAASDATSDAAVGRAPAIAPAPALDAAPAPGPARERIAVLILSPSDTDQALADSVTEVAISTLAGVPGRELVGTREFRRRIADVGAGPAGLRCLNQPACVGRIAVALGVRRALIGSVRAGARGYQLDLSLLDIETGRFASTLFRNVEGGVEALIDAVQTGAVDLFRRKPPPVALRLDSRPAGASVIVDGRFLGTTPIHSGPLDPGHHEIRVEMVGHFPWRQGLDLAPGGELHLELDDQQLRPRHTWAPYLAYGATGLAVVSFAIGASFGALADQPAMGRTRADAQIDLDRRQSQARVANIGLGGGAVLLGVAAFTFITYWRDIFGD